MLGTSISGYILSTNPTSPFTRLNVAAGVATDDTQTAVLQYAGGVLDCATVGPNGMDQGSLSAASWEHVFVIGDASGNTALLGSLNPTAPLLPAPYIFKRRIGSRKTDTFPAIQKVFQIGGENYWYQLPTPLFDYQTTNLQNNVTTLITLPSVPLGVKVKAFLTLDFGDSGGANAISCRISDPDIGPNPFVNGGLGPLGFDASGPFTQEGSASIWTNLNAQIALQWAVAFVRASTAANIGVSGWFDPRGNA